jgi:hypothetical protein
MFGTDMQDSEANEFGSAGKQKKKKKKKKDGNRASQDEMAGGLLGNLPPMSGLPPVSGGIKGFNPPPVN